MEMQSFLEKNSLQKDDKRQNLLDLLYRYSKFNQSKKDSDSKEQAILVEKIKDFVLKTPKCFERESSGGHITGSAFIVNSDLTHCLMTKHKKLKKWIQLGGHADGHPLIYDVSLKEAKEESGLSDFDFIDIKNFPKSLRKESALPFDIDIHMIPKTPYEDKHFHYDIRFLFRAHEWDKISISSESLDLKWIPLDDVINYSQEISTLRQVIKVRTFIKEQKEH